MSNNMMNYLVGGRKGLRKEAAGLSTLKNAYNGLAQLIALAPKLGVKELNKIIGTSKPGWGSAEAIGKQLLRPGRKALNYVAEHPYRASGFAALSSLGIPAGKSMYNALTTDDIVNSAAGVINARYGQPLYKAIGNGPNHPDNKNQKGIADYLGTLGGGLGAATLGAIGAGALSSENKIRNAIIGGLIAGTLGAGAGYAYDSGMFDGLFGKKK